MTACALASGLGGCVDLPGVVFKPPPVELTSPIRADIAAADASKDPYPRFKDVPPTAPPDIRPASTWSQNTYDVLALRRSQGALLQMYPQTLTDTEGFAATNRAKAVAPPAPTNATHTDDYAKTQRARATPPSPAQ